MSESILKLMFLVHTLFWFYMIFGSFISVAHARFILFWLVPITYAWQSLKVHLLVEAERYMVGSSATNDQIMTKMIELLPGSVHIKNMQHFLNENCFQSPLSAQGMIILSAIISSRVAFT